LRQGLSLFAQAGIKLMVLLSLPPEWLRL
jgi:hypothetical protein